LLATLGLRQLAKDRPAFPPVPPIAGAATGSAREEPAPKRPATPPPVAVAPAPAPSPPAEKPSTPRAQELGRQPHPRRVSAGPSGAVSASGELLLAPADEATKRGWLRVGGPALAGGQVSVDGATIGFAPVEKEIPAGSHSITIVDPATGHVELHKTV